MGTRCEVDCAPVSSSSKPVERPFLDRSMLPISATMRFMEPVFLAFSTRMDADTNLGFLVIVPAWMFLTAWERAWNASEFTTPVTARENLFGARRYHVWRFTRSGDSKLKISAGILESEFLVHFIPHFPFRLPSPVVDRFILAGEVPDVKPFSNHF